MHGSNRLPGAVIEQLAAVRAETGRRKGVGR